MAAISDQDMNAMLAEESRQHTVDFNVNCALQELYNYADRYYEQLMMALEEDEFSQKQRLAYRLEQVRNLMQAEMGSPWISCCTPYSCPFVSSTRNMPFIVLNCHLVPFLNQKTASCTAVRLHDGGQQN